MEINFSVFGAWLEQNAAIFSGILGSATSSYFTGNLTTRERFAAFFLGIGPVYAATDWVVDYLGMSEKLAGYLIGFFGINICAAFLKGVRRFGDDADFWTLFREAVLNLVNKVKATVDSATDSVQQPTDKE